MRLVVAAGCAAGGLAALAATACQKKQDAAASSEPAGVVGSAGSAASPTPARADALIAEALARGSAGMRVDRLTIKYVRADGVLDPKYGSLDLTLLGPEKPLPPDDPNRPLGAPDERVRPPADCRSLAWDVKGAAWQDSTMCFSMSAAQPPPIQCSVASIFRLAIADGAPGAALATLSLDSLGDERSWLVSIEDGPRGISFRQRYPDDAARCPPVAELER